MNKKLFAKVITAAALLGTLASPAFPQQRSLRISTALMRRMPFKSWLIKELLMAMVTEDSIRLDISKGRISRSFSPSL